MVSWHNTTLQEKQQECLPKALLLKKYCLIAGGCQAVFKRILITLQPVLQYWDGNSLSQHTGTNWGGDILQEQICPAKLFQVSETLV